MSEYNACWFIRIILCSKVSISIQHKSCVLHWNRVSENKMHIGFHTRHEQCISPRSGAVFRRFSRNFSILKPRKFSFSRSDCGVARKWKKSQFPSNLCTNNMATLKRQKKTSVSGKKGKSESSATSFPFGVVSSGLFPRRCYKVK